MKLTAYQFATRKENIKKTIKENGECKFYILKLYFDDYVKMFNGIENINWNIRESYTDFNKLIVHIKQRKKEND
jgi:hypothetical protein